MKYFPNDHKNKMIIKCPIIRRFVTFVLLLLVFGWTSVSISDKVSVISHQDRDSVINQVGIFNHSLYVWDVRTNFHFED